MRHAMSRHWADALLAAALLLAALAAKADATALRFSNSGIRATIDPLTIVTGPGGEMGTAGCPVTIEGTLHGTVIGKRAESLIGYVTRALLDQRECIYMDGAEHAWLLNGREFNQEGRPVANTLPWHIRYETFTGTLPLINVLRMRLIGFSVEMTILIRRCLYRSTPARPARFELIRSAGGELNEIEWDVTAPIPWAAIEVFCPTVAGIGGRGEFMVLERFTEVRVTLI